VMTPHSASTGEEAPSDPELDDLLHGNAG
jgi:hypothetical protein